MKGILLVLRTVDHQDPLRGEATYLEEGRQRNPIQYPKIPIFREEGFLSFFLSKYYAIHMKIITRWNYKQNYQV